MADTQQEYWSEQLQILQEKEVNKMIEMKN